MASFYVPIPTHLPLRADDHLRMDIRVRSNQSPIWHRINLISLDQRVFRYDEDRQIGPGWQTLDWRIWDFGATFWSRASKDYRLHSDKVCLIRISLKGMELEDTVEIRYCGLTRR